MSNHQSEQSNRRRLNMFSHIGKRVFRVLLSTFILGFALCLWDNNYLKKECKTTKEDTSLYCVSSIIIGNLGLSLITSVITILVAELALKEEVIQQIQDIWNSRQATRYIKAFYPKQSDYKELIVKNINNRQHNQDIKFLCYSEELGFLQGDETMEALKKKLRSGYHFQILILHPESSVLSHMEKAGARCSKADLTGHVHTTLKKVSDAFQGKNLQIKGAIEVRLKKDLFSPIGYYSSLEMDLVWMRFSTSNENRSPGFEILDEELSRVAKLHFKNLWEKSTGQSNLLLKINSSTHINEISKIF